MQESKATKQLDTFIISQTSKLFSVEFERIFTSFAVTSEKHVYPCLSSQEFLYQAHAAFQDSL